MKELVLSPYFEDDLTFACAQLRQARAAAETYAVPLGYTRRRILAVLAVCVAVPFLVAAGMSWLRLKDHVGDTHVEAVYDAEGAQQVSADGYPIWVVTESDDPELPKGTYVVVNQATHDFAVYAPPADDTQNTNSVVTVSGKQAAPITEYASWEILKNGSIRIYAENNTVLYAMAEGTVTQASFEGLEGNVLTVMCADGSTYRYAHCADFCVAVGDGVVPGEPVAHVGQTGRADRPQCIITVPDEWEINSFFEANGKGASS